MEQALESRSTPAMMSGRSRVELASLLATIPAFHFAVLSSRIVEIGLYLFAFVASARGGRVVSCLEGGYAPSALGRSAAAHVEALIGAA